MARPSSAAGTLKKHLTKAEKAQRSAAEKGTLSGKPLHEMPDVKARREAHAEFLRVSRLMAAIGKDDALYEAVIGRYCILKAECSELETVKQEFRASREELKQEYLSGRIAEDTEGGLSPSAYYKLLAAMQANYLAVDRQIQAKQKMAFDIEKECAMTVAASLRSIPKAPDKAQNPLLAALQG